MSGDFTSSWSQQLLAATHYPLSLTPYPFACGSVICNLLRSCRFDRFPAQCRPNYSCSRDKQYNQRCMYLLSYTQSANVYLYLFPHICTYMYVCRLAAWASCCVETRPETHLSSINFRIFHVLRLFGALFAQRGTCLSHISQPILQEVRCA